jgi:hypothetical protein
VTQEIRFHAGKMFLERLMLNEVRHSRRTFLDHLVSTAKLLRAWGCPEVMCLAGLFHAIYGTESFEYPKLQMITREAIREVIGVDAENVAWLFGMSTAKSLQTHLRELDLPTMAEKTVFLSHRVTGSALACTRSELLALANVTCANALDQAYHLTQRYDAKKLSTFRFLFPYIPIRGVEEFNHLICQRQDAAQEYGVVV